ncbi:Gfo/Idh/MocA family oxidoreductase [bacterium]|nr:Gfo/Idh/MocA family oxidoreductase [bacterium]
MAKRKATPIRVGIAGVGRAGHGMHLREIRAEEYMGKSMSAPSKERQKHPEKFFELVAFCDPYEPWRKRIQETVPDIRAFETLDEMLADKDVELVVIATRSCDHYSHALAALRAGKHVLLEKPMCATYAEAKRLIKAAEKAQGRLFVRQNRRGEAAFLHTLEIIDSGILGKVHEVRLQRLGYQRRDDWQTIMKYGGGQLLNWGPHLIDQALQFLGAPEKPLQGIWSYLEQIAAAGDAEDHVKVCLQGASGAIVDIEISGGSAIQQPEIMVWGDKGALTITGNDIHLRYLNPKQKLKPQPANEGVPGAGFGSAETLKWIEKDIPVKSKKNFDMYDELFRCIRFRKNYEITLAQALEVMRVIDQTKKGTRFGKK